MLESSAFVWQAPAIAGGDPEGFVKILNDAGLSRVAIKAANSTWMQQASYSAYPGWGQNIKPELVAEIKSAGIKFDVWHYVYGFDSAGEARVAKQVCDLFEPDVYIWNSEGSFEQKSGRVANANVIGSQLKLAFPNVKQALCTWAFPLSPIDGRVWHPTDVIKAYLNHVDMVMPMMYWGGNSVENAIKYYEDSIRVWRGIDSRIPIVPIGRGYDGDGGYATPSVMLAFKEHAITNKVPDNLIGINWYSLDEIVKNPTWFDAIRTIGTVPPPGELTDKEKLDRLVEHHSNLFQG